MITKKTKIIATIGPSCADKKTLEKIITLGMDSARLNFSHGSHQEHGKIIKLIREIEKKLNKPVAIIADIQGPKIRLGDLPEKGVEIKNGDEITIDTSTRDFHENRIPLPSLLFRDGVKEGSIVFIDDGALQLKISSKRAGMFKAIVIRGGILFAKKGVNVPDLEMKSSLLNIKDKNDIDFAIKSGVDYIALSFLRNAEDIKEAKRFLGKSKVKIIAKIERKEALKNIDEITDQADAVMIARGDLGIETPLWELPVRQKEIIESVRAKMKPVIVATQMLDSMIRNPVPTRAEVSDVANAVFDSADAVMLSGETAFGKYPVEAVSMMVKILQSTDDHQDFPYDYFQEKFCLPEFLCAEKSIIDQAEKSQSKAIIISTNEDLLIRATSHFRPKSYIIAAEDNQVRARYLNLIWGVTPIIINNKDLINGAKDFLVKSDFLKRGDKIVCALERNLKDNKVDVSFQQI